MKAPLLPRAESVTGQREVPAATPVMLENSMPRGPQLHAIQSQMTNSQQQQNLLAIQAKMASHSRTLFGDGVVQKGGKQRWTPQQQSQSDKFWERKAARLARQQAGYKGYARNMKDNHGVDVTLKQARELSATGIAQEKLAPIIKAGVTADEIVRLYRDGFTLWALEKVASGKFYRLDLLAWTGKEAPDSLINTVLHNFGIAPWIAAAHGAAQAAGTKLLEGKRDLIAGRLGVNISQETAVAFVFENPAVYESACIFASIKDALISHDYLEPGLEMLIAARKDKTKTENAIQAGRQMFFKGKPEEATVVHESIHFYGAQEKFIQDFCFGNATRINEGFTEFLARKVKAADKGRKRQVYPKQVAAVKFMEAHLGLEILKQAYFTGNVATLKSEYLAKIGRPWTQEEESDIISKSHLQYGE